MKLPATELLYDLAERAQNDVGRVIELWPLVREHYRRGGAHLPAGIGGGGHSDGVHSDPTADAALELLESGPEPEVLDRRALLQALDAFQRICRARQALEARIPAQAAALRMGNEATDGRTEAEVVAIKEHRRAVKDDLECLICGEVSSRRPSGMCPACWAAWDRAGRPDKGEWKPKRLRWLAEKRAIAEQNERLAADRGRWDTARHFSIGPADGVDRRAA